MPLTCCSIGAATVSATTRALAPGYWIDTCTPGGTIGGYCATGNVKSAIAPARAMAMDSTVAKIGRSMKKRVSMSASHGGRFERRHRRLLCRYLHVRPELLDRPHDDPIVFRQAARDRAETVRLEGPGDDLAVFGLVRRIDDVNVLLPLIGLNGPIDDEQGRVRWAERQPNPYEHAGQHQADAVGRFGVGEHAAHGDAAGVGIELVIGKVDIALVRKRLFARHSQKDRDLRLV